ncbi:hypothetical protein BH11MYX4_BH11MYX4_15670 [soil metagenome]
MTAASRIEALRDAFTLPGSRAHVVLTVVAGQERKHGTWDADLLRARGLDVHVEAVEDRYWRRTVPEVVALETGAAIGAHAEQMRLAHRGHRVGLRSGRGRPRRLPAHPPRGALPRTRLPQPGHGRGVEENGWRPRAGSTRARARALIREGRRRAHRRHRSRARQAAPGMRGEGLEALLPQRLGAQRAAPRSIPRTSMAAAAHCLACCAGTIGTRRSTPAKSSPNRTAVRTPGAT